jgi:hypothetical protein
MTRRTFLVTGAATVAVAACGGGSGGGGGGNGLPDNAVIVRRFDAASQQTGRVRLPVSLAVRDGNILDTGPAELTARLTDTATGATVATLTAARHGEGLASPYWPFVAEVTTAGIYELAIDGTVEPMSFQVVEPGTSPVPQVGDPLPGFDTPTTASPGGVEPICTREQPCPFHAVTLTEALVSGKPVAYLVGTPAHCATAVCGPILDFLMAEAERVGDAVVFVHAEVYTDDTLATVAPAVQAYGLTFEPVVFLADASGVLRSRLDGVVDRAELAAEIDRLRA